MYIHAIPASSINVHHLRALCASFIWATTRCNTLQHVATRCNTLVFSISRGGLEPSMLEREDVMQYVAVYCNTLQHTRCVYFWGGLELSTLGREGVKLL